MEDIETMKVTGATNRIECHKSKGFYGGILQILEGLLQEKAEVPPSKERTPYLNEKTVRFFGEEVEKGLEEKRKLLLDNTGVDNLEFQDINCNDLKFLNWNEAHNQMYSDIKQDIVSEAIRVLHLSSEDESSEQNDGKDDVSTSVTDEFVTLLSEAYKDNQELHFISSKTFNQILQSYGDRLSFKEKRNVPQWKKIFSAVYHMKHFYGCIAHVRERKFYIVDSCSGEVSMDSYRSTVLVLLAYMTRNLKLSRDNWTVYIVKNYRERHVDRNSGVFMCKYFQYWAKGERLRLDRKNIVAARWILLFEVKKRKLTDDRTWEENLKQCVARGTSDYCDTKMECSSSSKIPFEGNTKIILKLAQATQSHKDYDNQTTESIQVDLRKLQPEWLDRFFKRTFFDPCSKHPIRRNELNKYCIDCDAPLCQYCLSLASHSDHRLLKIYRHVYKDVVPLDEIEQHIDCSQIQPYRCNKQLVIALTPLPHSGSKTSEESTCQICKRKLIEYDIYSFCSISCKVEAVTRKENDSTPPFLLLDQLRQKTKQEPEQKKIRKRKGIPQRAPFS